MGAESDGARGRSAALAWLAVVLLALLPSVGTLRAPWLAEDAAILGDVAQQGAWADWTRSQYDMQSLRFWRPVVTGSWALQEAASGIAPRPLRLFNLGAHALVALAVLGLARRLGAGTLGAFLAGAWIALFPEQGGTSTWLAGRTDVLGALFLVASAWAALGRTPLLAAPLAFLACATKEYGFLAPLWVFVLARARGEELRRAAARTGPVALAVAVAFVWRRLALGSFVGGYPAPLPWLGAGLLGTAAALAAWAPSLAGGLAVAASGLVQRAADRRALAAALLLAAAALVPLYPLLADGYLEPQNRRLFYVPECAIALAAGLAWGRCTAWRALGVVPLLVLGGRLVLAWNDTHEWARAAHAGEEQVVRARAAVAGAERSGGPVLFTGFSSAYEGAYCLGFGLAARFRAPFPASPRPVWPWRLAFAPDPARERAALVPPRAQGSLWPLDDPLRVPELSVSDEHGAPATGAPVDERAFLASEDRSPRLAVAGGPSGARLEGVLFTELGYEPFALGTLDAGGAGAFTLMQLLASANGAAAGAQLLEFAADFGATRAYLELRATDAGGTALAASRWLELAWTPDLRARARALSAR